MISINDEKNLLRKEIEEKTKNVQGDYRLFLDKELLESLIFRTIELKDGRVCKIIVWSGDFLSKIDLRDINFDNVYWNTNITHLNKFLLNNIVPITKTINLKNTNACIDFSKAFALDGKNINVCNCNFKNVNLTRSHANIIKNSINSNYCDTNANLELIPGKSFVCCNLKGLDFSQHTVTIKSLENYDTSIINLFNSDVRDTELKVLYDYKRPANYKYALEKFYILNKLENLDNDKQKELDSYRHVLPEYIELDLEGIQLSQLIKDGELDGCYVNGILVKPKRSNTLVDKDEKILKLKKKDSI